MFNTRNILEINGYRALIQYDSEIDMFRGEFTGLNASADFYASDIEGFKKEGGISHKVFLQMCIEDEVEPKKNYSGKFNVRVPPELYEDIASVVIPKG